MTAWTVGAAAVLVAIVVHECWVIRRQRRWREQHEGRMAAMAERRAQAQIRPHTGHVTHLGGNGFRRR